VERGWLYFINGYVAEGISILENATQSDTTKLGAIMHLVSIYDSIENKETLDRFIFSVINSNPQDINLCVNIAQYFVEKDPPEYDAAIKVIKLGIMENPDDPEIYQFAGSFYEQQGSYNEAISHYKKAIEIVDFDPLAYFRIGNAYLKFGDRKSAIDWFSIATALSEDFKPIVEKLLVHDS
jgi:tetratricopeptide (TPR) repeat protein